LFNFFKKDKSDPKEKPASLKQRLVKSRQKLGSGLSSLLLGKKEINDDLLDELETLLITADIGINTTDKVLESVRKNASRKILKNSDSLYQFLKDELRKLLIDDNQLNINVNSTFVILVVGVNGAGKTTTIGKAWQNHFKTKVNQSCLPLVTPSARLRLNS